MSYEIWVAYVIAVLVMMIAPGSSHLLMLSHSLSFGARKSMAVAIGDLSANVFQMMIASTGLISILYASQYTFMVIKWLGVAYLLYLGIAQFRRKQLDEPLIERRNKSAKSLYAQGFVTSAANPQAIIFFAALFPQFVNVSEPALNQFLILGATYIVVDALFLTGYGVSAEWIARKFKDRVAQHLNKISGASMIAAAIVLGFKRVDSR